MPERSPEDIIADLHAAAARLSVKLRACQARNQALEETLQPFAEAWTARAPRFSDSPKAYQRRLERALEGFYSVRGEGREERLVLTGRHLKDAHDLLAKRKEDRPCTG